MPNMEAITVARIFVNEFICRFGVPEQLHTDQGRNFESALLKEICKLLGITKTRTTPYHPQSDRMIERFNRTLLNMLSTVVQDGLTSPHTDDGPAVPRGKCPPKFHRPWQGPFKIVKKIGSGIPYRIQHKCEDTLLVRGE